VPVATRVGTLLAVTLPDGRNTADLIISYRPPLLLTSLFAGLVGLVMFCVCALAWSRIFNPMSIPIKPHGPFEDIELAPIADASRAAEMPNSRGSSWRL
jgi:hypothetical protein